MLGLLCQLYRLEGYKQLARDSTSSSPVAEEVDRWPFVGEQTAAPPVSMGGIFDPARRAFSQRWGNSQFIDQQFELPRNKASTNCCIARRQLESSALRAAGLLCRDLGMAT